MNYNLTETQKDILRWMVKKVRGDELSEEFQVSWRQSERGYKLTDYKGDEAELPKISNTVLDALETAKLLLTKSNFINTHSGNPQEIGRDCSLTGLSYTAVDNNFQELPPQMAQITIGALIRNMSGGNVQAVGIADDGEFSQIVNDPELLRSQVETLVENLLKEVKKELNADDFAIYTVAIQEFRDQLLSDKPDPSVISQLLRFLGFLGDVEGTIGLMSRVWSALYPLLLIFAARFPEM